MGLDSPDFGTNEQDTLREASQPVGERIIGLVDPCTLSREEFTTSTELLFHGSHKPFVFSRDIDYDEYIEGKGGYTLGLGFYTTDNKREAQIYSLGKQLKKSDQTSEAHVLELLPYQVHMLDLRSADDLSVNAPVSVEFIINWCKYFTQQYKELLNKTEKSEREQLELMVYGNYAPKAWRLLRTQSNLEPIYLHKLLCADDGHAGFVQSIFTKFMLSQGYDGLICNEKGDYEELGSSNCATYVFYNLEKVGTYDIYHQGNNATQTPISQLRE